MAKLIIGIVIGALVVYLVMNSSEDAQTSANLSESPEYVANKAVAEAMFQAVMDEDMEAWAATVSDTVKYTSPLYAPGTATGVGTKEDWMKDTQRLVDNFDDFSIEQAVYLPGLDGQTAVPNGSVRVYVHWNATHLSGVKVDPWFYYNFDKFEGGKITTYGAFGDAGGVMNNVAAASAGE